MKDSLIQNHTCDKWKGKREENNREKNNRGKK